MVSWCGGVAPVFTGAFQRLFSGQKFPSAPSAPKAFCAVLWWGVVEPTTHGGSHTAPGGPVNGGVRNNWGSIPQGLIQKQIPAAHTTPRPAGHTLWNSGGLQAKEARPRAAHTTPLRMMMGTMLDHPPPPGIGNETAAAGPNGVATEAESRAGFDERAGEGRGGVGTPPVRGGGIPGKTFRPVALRQARNESIGLHQKMCHFGHFFSKNWSRMPTTFSVLGSIRTPLQGGGGALRDKEVRERLGVVQEGRGRPPTPVWTPGRGPPQHHAKKSLFATAKIICPQKRPQKYM